MAWKEVDEYRTCALLQGRHIENAIGINVKGDLDLGVLLWVQVECRSGQNCPSKLLSLVRARSPS